MDLANFGRIIIKQRNDPVRAGRIDLDFLLDFTLNAGEVGVPIQCKQALVPIIHMSADSDRTFRDQALFAGLLSPLVAQDKSAASENCVRDDLFQAGIGLRGRTGSKEIIFSGQESRKISFNREIQALKKAD